MPKKIQNQGAMAAVLCAVLLAACMAGLLAACITSGVPGESTGLVARTDFNANQEWQPPQVMGRNFWNMLNIYGRNFVGITNVALDEFNFKKLKDKPVYKESGIGYSVNIFNKDSNTVSTAEIFRSSWPNYPRNHKNLPRDFFKQAFEATINPNAPFFVMPDDARPPWLNPLGKHSYDFAGYAQWKKDHPNFMGFTQGEWCNECILSGPWREDGGAEWLKKVLTKEQVENVAREFPSPATREEALALVKKLCGLLQTFYFNDPEKLSYLRGCMNVDHYAYEWGAEIAWLETTNTGGGSSHYRWRPQFFFIRGASHQYGKKWGWYLASFYNGYPAAGGARVGDSHVRYIGKARKQTETYFWCGPDFGMSLSLYTRVMYLAYLAGPSFVEHEETQKFVNEDGNFSPWGKALEEWFDFTQNNKRGITYAPVALLIPFEQCYPAYGGKSWHRYKYERPDWMIDAFMFTIAPHNPMTRDGNEGCLSDSPYGDIYDAILPNTPEKPVALNVLNKYKVAIMLGRYAKDKALAGRLMEYVKDGGTLLINIKQLNEFFPESFTGIKRTNISKPVKGDLLSVADGAKIPLTEQYDFEEIKPAGAKPVLTDADENIIASINDYGKGRVIVTTADYLVPANDMSQALGYGGELPCYIFGKKFPFQEYFLKQIVKEVLPLEVKGDIEYGLNKLDDGWLLYLINNKGVTKFVDKIQALDPSKTAKVEVFLKNMQSSGITELRAQKAIVRDAKNNAFTIEIPPGEVKVVKIKN